MTITIIDIWRLWNKQFLYGNKKRGREVGERVNRVNK